MNPAEAIDVFSDFIEIHYKSKLLENIAKGLNFLIIDFKSLAKFNIDLSDDLLDNPEEMLRAAELSVKQMDLGNEVGNVRIRFKNLPDSQSILIRDLRTKHLNKFITMNGAVRQKTDVRPQVTLIRYECPACGNMINIIQLEKKIKEPSKCGCGRKGRFKVVNQEMIDFQGMQLEELTTELDGATQPKRIQLFLKEDLVSPENDRKTNPGTTIRVSGILKQMPIEGKNGGRSTTYQLYIEVNYFEPLEEDLYNIEISNEDIKEIRRLSRTKDIFQKLSESLAPGIFGYEKIKEALVLQFLGGVHKVMKSDGTKSRGDIHILLIGDPGAGKSQLLKRCQIVAPKARYSAGKGSSGVGLTASVVKDDFLGGWALEAGALPLANKGICILDELDKMSDDDRSYMHEALEQQTVTVNKASIQATLHAQTTVLAAANPKLSRFDPYGTVAEQINMPSSLINRFDLIFPIIDIANKAEDWKKAKFMSGMEKDIDVKKPEIETDILRKYLAYARQHVNPSLTNEAINEMNSFWVKLRNGNKDDGKNKSIPINARILKALYRLAEASAKSRLNKTVTIQDAKKSIELMYFCMSQIGIDPQTGEIDMDRIETGIPTTTRKKFIDIKKIINSLAEKIGNHIPIQDIINESDAYGISDSEVEDIISKLKRSGDIYEPKRGFIQKI